MQVADGVYIETRLEDDWCATVRRFAIPTKITTKVAEARHDAVIKIRDEVIWTPVDSCGNKRLRR